MANEVIARAPPLNRAVTTADSGDHCCHTPMRTTPAKANPTANHRCTDAMTPSNALADTARTAAMTNTEPAVQPSPSITPARRSRASATYLAHTAWNMIPVNAMSAAHTTSSDATQPVPGLESNATPAIAYIAPSTPGDGSARTRHRPRPGRTAATAPNVAMSGTQPIGSSISENSEPIDMAYASVTSAETGTLAAAAFVRYPTSENTAAAVTARMAAPESSTNANTVATGITTMATATGGRSHTEETPPWSGRPFKTATATRIKATQPNTQSFRLPTEAPAEKAPKATATVASIQAGNVQFGFRSAKAITTSVTVPDTTANVAIHETGSDAAIASPTAA